MCCDRMGTLDGGEGMGARRLTSIDVVSDHRTRRSYDRVEYVIVYDDTLAHVVFDDGNAITLPLRDITVWHYNEDDVHEQHATFWQEAAKRNG